jgi:hypothetical protein
MENSVSMVAHASRTDESENGPSRALWLAPDWGRLRFPIGVNRGFKRAKGFGCSKKNCWPSKKFSLTLTGATRRHHPGGTTPFSLLLTVIRSKISPTPSADGTSAPALDID